MSHIEEIKDPLTRFIAFIEERELIRQQKEAGKPWPWTDDTILQSYRFTNINRENDKVSKHYQKTVRDRYGDTSLVIPGTVLYRWFNRIKTCDALFNQPDIFGNETPFERSMSSANISPLQFVIENTPTPHVTGAFIIQGMTGYSKGQGVLQYFQQWCLTHDWGLMFSMWNDVPHTLDTVFTMLKGDGLGSFMTAQLVADLKYLPCLERAPDWWTWAAPGPGSKRGLNAVLGRPMGVSWNDKEWLEQLHRLRDKVNPKLEKETAIKPLHAQDLQNCLCEFSKYEKTRLGNGRPRQVYHGQ